MSEPQLFHRIFVLLFLTLVVLRFYWHFRAKVWSKELAPPEGKVITFLRIFVALPLFALVTAYMFDPAVLSWSEVPMTAGLRWLGAAVTTLGLCLAAWVHYHLGLNFSPYLRIRGTHRLVTSGPYRWVRHPMYTAFVTVFVGFLLLTGNLLIAGMGLATLLIVMVVRTPKEEQMLLDRFGQEYRDYMGRTGRYLPRLSRRHSAAAAANGS